MTLLALALAACQDGSPAAPPPPSGGDVAATNTVVGPPPVRDLGGAAAFAATSAGTVPLQAGVETGVEPRASFRVELPVALADARLSLLDGDALVPSSGAREVGQATNLTLAPTLPLAPGARLTLRVDGATTRELHAGDGRRFGPLEWPLLVTGEPAPRKAPARRARPR